MILQDWKPADRKQVGCLTLLLAFLMPPLAVLHKGPLAVIIVALCTFFGFWILGTFVALMMNGD